MIERCAVQLPPLGTEEADNIPFEFGAYMAADEMIATAAVFCAPAPGEVDQGAQSMVSGSPVIGDYIAPLTFQSDAMGRVVLQRFDPAGRPPRTLYDIWCDVTLSSGRRLTASATISVQKLPMPCC